MKTIRPNVFETNSSSEHTICFPCASACENLNPAPQTLTAHGEGEYGWGYDVLDTPYSLLDYWLVAIKDTGICLWIMNLKSARPLSIISLPSRLLLKFRNLQKK